jgi:hypothetical protein
VRLLNDSSKAYERFVDDLNLLSNPSRRPGKNDNSGVARNRLMAYS